MKKTRASADRLVHFVVRTLVLCTSVACADSGGLTEWAALMRDRRPYLPAAETRSPRPKATSASLLNAGPFDASEAVAIRVLGDFLPEEVEWRTTFESAEERIDICGFTQADGTRNSFAVYNQLGSAVPYYWTVDGLSVEDGIPTRELLETYCLVGASSAITYAEEPLSAEDVEIRELGESNAIVAPYSRFWFFFVDDCPQANWAHQCRYIFVSEDCTSLTVLYKMMPPRLFTRGTPELVNLCALAGESDSQAETQELEDVKANVYRYAKKLMAEKALSFRKGYPQNSYFVLICGGGDPYSNYIRFWSDTAMFYSTLTLKYGVDKDNILVFMSDGSSSGKDANLGGRNVLVSSPLDLDGDGKADVDGPAKKTDISTCFANLQSRLTADDQLFVFITSHGGPDGNAGLNNYDCKASLFSYDYSEAPYFTDDELASWTSGFSCPVAFAIETCFSGGFVDDIMNTPNRVIATACRHYEVSWGDYAPGAFERGEWIANNVGMSGTCNCWAGAFIAGLSGALPAPYFSMKTQGELQAYPWQWTDSLDWDSNGDGLVSFNEARLCADANDKHGCTSSVHPAWCSFVYDEVSKDYFNLNEHPQYAESTSGLGASFFVLKQTSSKPVEKTVTLNGSGLLLGGDSDTSLQGDGDWKLTEPYPDWIQACSLYIPGGASGQLSPDKVVKLSGDFIFGIAANENTTSKERTCTLSLYNQKSGRVEYKINVRQRAMQKYTITLYKNDGGSTSKSYTQTEGNTWALPSASSLSWSRTGYEFLGWSSSSSASEASFREGQSFVIWDAMTFYGVWRKKSTATYTVTFKSNGGSGSMEAQTVTGGVATKLNACAFTKTGYTFKQWSGSDGKTYKNQQSVTLSAGLTLTAQWTANTYSVSYAMNGGTKGSSAPTAATYDKAFKVSAPTKTRNKFLGWTVTSGLNIGTAKYGLSSSSQTYLIAGNWHVCSGSDPGDVWFLNLTPNANASVTLTANWAEEIVPTLPTPVIKSIEATSGIYGDEVVKLQWLPIEAATGYAVYRAVGAAGGGNRQRIKPLIGSLNTYNTIDGQTTFTKIYFAEDATAVPGVDYSYWLVATNASATSGYSEYRSAYRPATLTVSKSTLAFGADAASSNVTVTANATWGAVSSDPSWLSLKKTESILTVMVAANAKTTATNGAITVTAAAGTAHPVSRRISVVQSGLPVYTVTFNANGGIGGTTREVVSGGTLGTLPTVSRTGYAMADWWTAASGGSQVSASTKVTGKATYYAHWIANKYMVTLDLQDGSGGSASVTATYDDAMPSIPKPNRPGYAFGGYFTGVNGSGTRYYNADGTSAHKWDKDVATTLYARWTPIPATPDGNYTETVNGLAWTYAVSSGEAIVQRTGSGAAIPTSTAGNVAIPPTLGGCKVVEIGERAFLQCKGLTKVSIPSSVRKIGAYAFLGCENITAITIPPAVTTIGNCPFMDCDSLASISVANGNEHFKVVDGALIDVQANALIQYALGRSGKCTIPDDVHKIQWAAFSGASKLTAVTLPNTLRNIASWSFDNCTALNEVIIPASVTNIAYNAFDSCSALSKVVFAGNSPIVADAAFDGVPGTCVVYVSASSSGWGVAIPGTWKGLSIRHQDVVTYTVTYDPGKYGIGSLRADVKTNGVPLTLKGALFAVEGHRQTGWRSGETYPLTHQLNGRYSDNASITLYPYWSANQYAVHFNSNGGAGTMADMSMQYALPTNLTENAFKKNGYRFVGWATNAYGNVVYADGARVMNLTAEQGATVTLYAKWSPGETSPGNDNFANAIPLSGAYGEVIGSNVNATRESGEVSAVGLSSATNTVWWTWTAPSNGKVRFSADSSSFFPEVAVFTGNTLSSLALVASSGDRWWVEGERWSASFQATEGTTYRIQVQGAGGTSGLIRLNWRPEPSLVVELDANGGMLVDAAWKPVKKGGAVGVLPVPTRTGYVFKGWYTKKSGGTKITAKTKVTKDVTWYAQWTGQKYPVTVVKVGKGTVSGAGSKAYKSTVTLKAAAAGGYVFQGWYLNGVLKSQKASYAVAVPLGGVTYTAKFITKAADKAGIEMAFGGVEFRAVDGSLGEAVLPVVTNTCGVVTAWSVAASGVTPVSVSVSGLPKGMKYDVKKKAITGVPSTANKSGTMKITVKSAGASQTWNVKWRTVALPAFARGTFNGWTYGQMENGEWEMDNAMRKVTVSVTSAGKITAKVGPLSFARTGWTVGDDGFYRVTLSKTRTVGTGKKAKRYKDAVMFVLDPMADWTEDQLAGTIKTCLATKPDMPVNSDRGILARRNPFGNNAEAKAIARSLAALGSQRYVDAGGLVWNVKVSASGVATISRTTGSGKKKRTISATAMVEVVCAEGGGYQAVARFLVGGKVIEVTWQ